MTSAPFPPEPGHAPLSDAGKTARQHAHDVRNQLNSMELGMTLIEELAGGDEEIGSTMSQLRQSVALIEASLKSLVRRFAEPRPASVPAWELARLWEPGLRALLPPTQALEWNAPASGLSLWLDAAGVGSLVTELILMLSRRCKGQLLKIRFAGGGGQESVIELREPPRELPLNVTFLEDISSQIQRQGGRMESFREETSEEWIYRLVFPSPAFRAAGGAESAP